MDVVGAGWPFPDSYFTDVEQVRSVHESGSGAPYQPFTSFRLPAHSTRDVVVSMRLAPACSPSQSLRRNEGVVFVRAVPVTYRFLGVEHTTTVPLDFAVSVDRMLVCGDAAAR